MVTEPLPTDEKPSICSITNWVSVVTFPGNIQSGHCLGLWESIHKFMQAFKGGLKFYRILKRSRPLQSDGSQLLLREQTGSVEGGAADWMETIKDQVRFDVAVHAAIWGDVPQVVARASLGADSQPAALHHQTAGGLQATVLHQLETHRAWRIGHFTRLEEQLSTAVVTAFIQHPPRARTATHHGADVGVQAGLQQVHGSGGQRHSASSTARLTEQDDGGQRQLLNEETTEMEWVVSLIQHDPVPLRLSLTPSQEPDSYADRSR
ncbi:hypothetical protein EYF80_027764 [Liparis tanakae]|uniref:Uncharacterized protein n=1 Tax=Liparis tanakae TaxID=230148 RepID=A0A4Z2H8C3_9TELE|nr:hypothetical protein EYF80_027764 [Liparis tanakae]